MKHYTAQIIYRILCDGVMTEQYEEQWRLIAAYDYKDALEEARRVGDEEASTFVDRHGRTIQWEFIAVKDLSEVNLRNGALLFSTIREMGPVTAPVWAAVH